MNQLSHKIGMWNNLPLPVTPRLYNMHCDVIPKITYTLDCIPIVSKRLLVLQRMLKDSLLAIVAPQTVWYQTMSSFHHGFGNGMSNIHVVVATRMLDNVSKVFDWWPKMACFLIYSMLLCVRRKLLILDAYLKKY